MKMKMIATALEVILMGMALAIVLQVLHGEEHWCEPVDGLSQIKEVPCLDELGDYQGHGSPSECVEWGFTPELREDAIADAPADASAVSENKSTISTVEGLAVNVDVEIDTEAMSEFVKSVDEATDRSGLTRFIGDVADKLGAIRGTPIGSLAAAVGGWFGGDTTSASDADIATQDEADAEVEINENRGHGSPSECVERGFTPEHKEEENKQ